MSARNAELRREAVGIEPSSQLAESDILRRSTAEALGSALLVSIVVGSGIMAERLSGGNIALALLGNTIATGAGLTVLILVLGPVSGAHLNPAVTLAFALRARIVWNTSLCYLLAQLIGAGAGAMLAHFMFEEPLIAASTHVRSGAPQWAAEFVATFGLVLTIFGCLKSRPEATPFAVGLFIVAGYWFTSSTSFANPAVTVARAMTDTFAGIRPVDAPAFIASQLAGAIAAALLSQWLFGPARERQR
jgi:glycerol uptake facilitator-like aquaporin